MNLIRILLHKLLGTRFVCLHDHDETITICRVRRLGPYLTAERQGFNIRRVLLLPSGAVVNGCYVKHWSKYLGDVTPISPAEPRQEKI